MKEAVLTGNYLYQHPDPDNTFTRQLEHVVSAHFKLEADKWGLRTDLSDAQGYLGQTDLLGSDGDAVLQHHRQAAGRDPLHAI